MLLPSDYFYDFYDLPTGFGATFSLALGGWTAAGYVNFVNRSEY
jgi:hypothetical protein